MVRVLVSFLGGYRAADPQQQGPGGRKDYDQTEYAFPETQEVRSATWSANALLQHLSAAGMPVDRLVVLGTSGSFWDTLLFEPCCNGEEGLMALYDEVDRHCAQDAFTQEMADRCRAPLSGYFGIAVEPCVVPYGKNRIEQLAMLHRLRDRVPRKGNLQLDVTHSLRHLPLLATVAAALLRRLHEVKVEAVWYGAAELRKYHNNRAPMLRLDALVEVIGWLEAFAALEATANPRHLLTPFRQSISTGHVGRALENAAHQMSVLRISGAAAEAKRAIASWPKDGVPGLFAGALSERLDWVNGSNDAEQMARLARLHLEHRDYLRALIVGYEAVTTSLPVPARNHDVWSRPDILALARNRSRQERLAARLAFLEDDMWRGRWVEQRRVAVGKSLPDQELVRKTKEVLNDLIALRNAVAHADEDVSREIEAILADENLLRKRVNEAFDLLL